MSFQIRKFDFESDDLTDDFSMINSETPPSWDLEDFFDVLPPHFLADAVPDPAAYAYR